MTLERGGWRCASATRDEYVRPAPGDGGRARAGDGRPSSGPGSHVFDYGNNLRTEALDAGVADAFAFPGFVPAYVRPLFCRGRRAVPLGGAVRRPGRHPPHRPRAARGVPRRRAAAALAGASRRSGSPSRGCRRASAGWATATGRRPGCCSTTSSARGEVSAPIVIGRDHLDTGSVASPYRETEAMKDGSDAIADWPILNALLNDGVRRVLGVGPPRRRRGHRQLDPRRAW